MSEDGTAASAPDAGPFQIVQSNWTGELDIYDIMELKFANDKMRCYQPVHNWIGTTQLKKTMNNEAPTFLPPPFGIRSPQQAREFNLALLHDRFGRDGVNKRRKKDMARRALIAKMRKTQLEREEESVKAFSPLKEYQRWCEPINSKLRTKQAVENRASKGSKDIMKRSTSQNLVKSSAPTWKMGERNDRAQANHSNSSPGPKYSITEATYHTTKRSAAVTMGGKLVKGGFLDAVGGNPKNPRSNPDAIGMDLSNWSNATQLDRATASARQKSNGKTFGVKHRHLNPKPNANPAPNEYAATMAFQQTIPSSKPQTMSSKSKSLTDLQMDEQLGFPGPAQYSPAKARSKLAFKEAPQFSLAEKLKSSFEQTNPTITPGPNNYGVPNNRFSSTKKHAPAHSFGYHKRGKTIIHAGDHKRGATRKKRATQTSNKTQTQAAAVAQPET